MNMEGENKGILLDTVNTKSHLTPEHLGFLMSLKTIETQEKNRVDITDLTREALRSTLETADIDSQDLSNNLDDALDLLSKDQMVSIQENEEIVAVCGYRLEGKTPDGAPMYMITKSFTLPTSRSKGYNRQLADAVFQEIQNKFPDAAIGSITRNPKVKNRNIDLGFTPVSVKEFSDMRDDQSFHLTEEEAMKREQNDWQAYIYYPKKN